MPRLGGDIGTARFVGTSVAATNFINGTSKFVAGNDVHSVNFNQYGQTPGFTRAALNYSRDVMRHDNTPYQYTSAAYQPSGRFSIRASVAFRF
jgi:hypothetical protein